MSRPDYFLRRATIIVCVRLLLRVR